MPAPPRRLPAIRLDFRSGLPVYLQIIRQVERLGSTGRIRPGDRLPTVRELAIQLGVNFNTVARAYRLLDRAGVVSAQRGRGTFVLENTTARRARNITLRELASAFIAEARRNNFSERQIAGMITSRLKSQIRAKRAGDNHG